MYAGVTSSPKRFDPVMSKDQLGGSKGRVGQLEVYRAQKLPDRAALVAQAKLQHRCLPEQFCTKLFKV